MFFLATSAHEYIFNLLRIDLYVTTPTLLLVKHYSAVIIDANVVNNKDYILVDMPGSHFIAG